MISGQSAYCTLTVHFNPCTNWLCSMQGEQCDCHWCRSRSLHPLPVCGMSPSTHSATDSPHLSTSLSPLSLISVGPVMMNPFVIEWEITAEGNDIHFWVCSVQVLLPSAVLAHLLHAWTVKRVHDHSFSWPLGRSAHTGHRVDLPNVPFRNLPQVVLNFSV